MKTIGEGHPLQGRAAEECFHKMVTNHFPY